MNEILIEAFLVTAESESMAAAAEKLYRSPQSLSKVINNLEEELGCTLFERSVKGIKLTRSGTEYYRFFKKTVQKFEQTLNTIHYIQESMRQNFRIGISPWIDPLGKIREVLLGFMKKNPDTGFEFVLLPNDELQTDIRENRLDAAIICNSQVYGNAETAIEDFAAEDLYLFFPESSGAPDPTSQILFDASFGDWSKQQWNAVSEKLSHRHVDADIRHTAHMPNLISALINVENAAGMAVCDVNFGYMASGRTEYVTMPIQMKSSLALIWNKQNENPLIPEFLTYAKTQYDPENHAC